MNGPFAVMDLGTNTFHLLIAKGNIAEYEEIAHLHEAVRLGEGGINKGFILPAAFERGLSAMREFHQLITKHKVEKLKAIGTSALRSATNGAEFINQVKAETGITIDLIDGDEEACYIYKGIKASGCLSDKNCLIMDIGGGSVEFILGNNEKITWKQSFEIGAARLMDKFNRVDPIPVSAIEDLHKYLDQTLGDLFAAVKGVTLYSLIGSSGAFETFASLAELERGRDYNLHTTQNYKFDFHDLLTVTDGLIQSSHQVRAANKAIIPVRVDMIVVASIITRYIMQKLAINKVSMSTYSLKEGVLAEMMINE